MSLVTGKCLCEEVSYEVVGELGAALNCHCSKCRRWHGAVFRTRTVVSKGQFRILGGIELIAKYNSSPNVTKHFCSKCGSPLHSTYLDKPDVVALPLAVLEGDIKIKPEKHIFVEFKASWYEISDELPQFGTY